MKQKLLSSFMWRATLLVAMLFGALGGAQAQEEKLDPVFNLTQKDIYQGTTNNTYTVTIGEGKDIVTDGSITLTSKDESKATVSGNTITAVALGPVTIHVETSEGETYKAGEADIEVTVIEKNTPVFKFTEKEIYQNNYYSLTKGTDNNKDITTDGSVTLTSSDTDVATVSGLKITAKALGTATIHVTTTEGNTYKASEADIEVTVIEKNTPVFNLTQKDIYYYPEGSINYYTLSTGKSGRDIKTDGKVTLTSSNTNVATVSGSKITAKALGTVTIHVTAAEGSTYKAGSADIEVTVIEKLDPVFRLTPQTLSTGNTYTLRKAQDPRIQYEVITDATSVSLESDNTAVATVNKLVVTAVGGGTAIITVSAPETQKFKPGSASFTVTVIPGNGKVLWDENKTTLIFVYDEESYQAGSTFSDYNITTVYPFDVAKDYSQTLPWKPIRGNVTKVVFDDSFADAAPLLKKTGYWFTDMTRLTSIVDISNLNTENVTSMQDMFENCSSLTEIDLNSFDTGNVTNIAYMFKGCSSLTELDLSNFNTSKVDNTAFMFDGCSSLESLDLSNFNTSNVTSMKNMFHDCKNLTELDLSCFDVSGVLNMSYMFQGCKQLETIYFDENAVFNLQEHTQMFGSCNELKGKCGTAVSANYSDKDGTYAKIYKPNLGEDGDGFFSPKHTRKLNAYGFATYASTIPVEFKTTDSYTAWKVTGIDGDNINFEQVTGPVPAGTGVLLMGAENGSAAINFYSGDVTEVTDNLLESIIVITEEGDPIFADEYYGLSGNQFVPVGFAYFNPTDLAKIGGKALLPADALGDVKSLNLVFNDETGVREIRTVSGEEAAEIFNLAGQRLQKAQKGVNIVNGKKVLVK